MSEGQQSFDGSMERDVAIQALLALQAVEGLAMVEPGSGTTFAGNPAFRRLCGLGENEEVCFADLLADPSARAGWIDLLLAGPVPELRPARLHLRLPGGGHRLVEIRPAWVLALGRDLIAVSLRDLSLEERLAGLAGQGRRLRSLGCLVHSLAHRFNNLLGVVTGYASQLVGTSQESREEQAARRILGAGQEAARLVAGVARVMGGLETIAPGPFDLRSELMVLRDLMDKFAQKRRLDFLIEAPERLFTFGRAELLRELLLEVTMDRFSSCVEQGRFLIRLCRESRLGGSLGKRGRARLCLSWEGTFQVPTPSLSPSGAPPEWTELLAQILGGRLDESRETGEVRLFLPLLGPREGSSA